MTGEVGDDPRDHLAEMVNGKAKASEMDKDEDKYVEKDKNGDAGLEVPPPPAPVEERPPRDLKAEAKSHRHLLTHTPYNPYCDACRIARMTRRPARRQNTDPDAKPKAFAELGNADYIVAQSEESMGLTRERDALVVVDRGTEYTDCFPLCSV